MLNKIDSVAPVQRSVVAGNEIVERHDIDPLGDMATPFGTDFFARCVDEVMSLHHGGRLPLIDWFGWTVSDELKRTLEFIAYTRPEQDTGADTPGYLATACTDPNGVEFGVAKLEFEGFGRYGRKGPARDMMKPEKYCKTSPRMKLDGSTVTDEREWDMLFVINQLLADIRKDVVTGNSSTAGQMGGLNEWVKTGYPGPNGEILDSIVIDWNGNTLAGGAGITWNGNAVGPAVDFYHVLTAAYNRIAQRIKWTPSLSSQRKVLGDMIMVMPTHMVDAILNSYTCAATCDPGVTIIDTLEARTFRNNLVAATNPNNLFGDGYIAINNTIVPLMAYDWGLEHASIAGQGDIFFLTKGIGSVKIWSGEHVSASAAADRYSDNGYYSVDGGRILGTTVTENECDVMKAWMHPRLFCTAPWAQIRFMDVLVDTPGGALSDDPASPNFPIKTFTPATYP